MTISKRIRERAAEVVRRDCLESQYSPDVCDSCADIIAAILAIPDDEQEQAIRAAVVAECLAIVEEQSPDPWFVVRDRIRALAPMPPGYVAVRVEALARSLKSLREAVDEYVALYSGEMPGNHENRSEVKRWRESIDRLGADCEHGICLAYECLDCKEAAAIRAALPEDPTNG